MKKPILLLLLIFAAFKQVNAQELVTAEQLGKLIGYLKDENWPEASKLSESYLKIIPVANIDDDTPAIIRYMYLTSQAGLMNHEGLTQEQALKNVKYFEGHTIALPSLYISAKDEFAFNKLQQSEGKTDTLRIAYSNRNATDIFAFEFIVLLKQLTSEEFQKNDGKLCTVSGILKTISVEGHILPRYRMVIEKATVELHD